MIGNFGNLKRVLFLQVFFFSQESCNIEFFYFNDLYFTLDLSDLILIIFNSVLERQEKSKRLRRIHQTIIKY